MKKKNGNSIKNIDYNIKQIEAFTSGEMENTLKILSVFVQTTIQNLEAFKLQLQEKNYKILSELAHKMLPLFRQLEVRVLIPPLEIMENSEPHSISNSQWENMGQSVCMGIEMLLEQLQADYPIDNK